MIISLLSEFPVGLYVSLLKFHIFLDAGSATLGGISDSGTHPSTLPIELPLGTNADLKNGTGQFP